MFLLFTYKKPFPFLINLGIVNLWSDSFKYIKAEPTSITLGIFRLFIPLLWYRNAFPTICSLEALKYSKVWFLNNTLVPAVVALSTLSDRIPLLCNK